jgi:pimeloyl-ACP methyl ester carboxylesterase
VFTEARGHHLEYQWLNEKSDATPLVFLHEGLGSIDLWRDFPSHVAVESDHPALVYSRYGHGHSDQLREPRTPHFMHDEAQESLPGLVDELVGRPPILVGHSDGASISLIYAGLGYPVEGLVLIAPHVMVETLGLRKIRSIADSYETTKLRTRLSKYHDDAEGLFGGWADVWLSDSFASWNIKEYLSKISCPILMIQCREDAYGSLKHLDIIEGSTSGPVTRLEIEGDSHSPHLSSPDIAREAAVDFIAGLDFTSP